MDQDIKLARIETNLEYIRERVDNLDARMKPVETHVLMLNSFVKFSAGLSGVVGFMWMIANIWGWLHG